MFHADPHRAAEKVILGEPSIGAGGSKASDLARASALATNAIASFGLGGRLLWHAEPGEFGPVATLRPEVADSAEALLRDAYAEAAALLRRRADALRAIAAALVAHRVLTGADVEAIAARTGPVGSVPHRAPAPAPGPSCRACAPERYETPRE